MPKRGGALLVGAAVTALFPFTVTPAVAHSGRCPDVLTAPVQRYALPPGTGGVAGLVASPRYPGWGWMVRQHKPPYLYAIRFPGGRGPHEVRAFRVLGIHKLDWGDLVYQDRKLYIVESDQLWTRTREGQMRVIHEIPEPDPHGPSWVRPTARYRYAYPDGQRHNTEGALSFDGRLVLVPKTTPRPCP